jgi:hypothetical protein
VGEEEEEEEEWNNCTSVDNEVHMGIVDGDL